MTPRLGIYTLLSTSLFSAVTLSALNSRPNFYAAAVAIGRNSGSMMVVWNMGIWGLLVLGIGVRKLFFGQLRRIEHEHLFERLWMFLTESLLALTIFRDDFTAPFALMYGLLVFLKCFHWITADRVDYMDQIPPPGPPTIFHIRLSTFITLLSTVDLLLVLYSLDSILTYGVSAMVLFTSEYMVLLASIWGTGAKYGVNCLDLRRARGREDAPAWEAKSMWMFYVDLAVDFAKLLTYLSFFTVILLNYGIPLHILRDVWMTLRSFVARCLDLIRYRRATRDMDAQYPNATEDDMGRLGDRVCIICREEMVVHSPDAGTERHEEGPNETPKKLICGHVFHFHCLRSWLERQQSCPTCRRDVLTRPTVNDRRQGVPPVLAPPAPAPAPAPAPGAVPQPAPEVMRARLNEFFRLPQENGAPPPAPGAGPTGLHLPPRVTPPATHVPTPTTAAAGTASTMTSIHTTQFPFQLQSDADIEIQRSIWGGPIQPGRFHQPPLGQLPRYSGPIVGFGNDSGPQASAGPSLRRQQPPSRVCVDDSSSGPQNEALHSAIPVRENSAPVSEVNTPFSSNPPEVFRSLSRSPDPNLRDLDTSDTNVVMEDTGEVDMDNVAERLGPETRNRRLAAEAAMRRLGITVSPTLNSNSNFVPSSFKGKEKEKAKVPENESWKPFLAIPDPGPPHPLLRPGLGQRGARIYAPRVGSGIDNGNNGNGNGNGSGGGDGDGIIDRQGVEDRLRVLRDIDDGVWKMIEDLTRLKSHWDVGGGESDSGSGRDGVKDEVDGGVGVKNLAGATGDRGSEGQ